MDFKSKQIMKFKNEEQNSLCREDAHCMVFDVKFNRKAHIHFLIIPKKTVKLSSASYEDEKLLGHLLLTAKNVAIANGLHKTGYNVVVDEDYGTTRLKCLHVFGDSTEIIRPMTTKSRL